LAVSPRDSSPCTCVSSLCSPAVPCRAPGWQSPCLPSYAFRVFYANVFFVFPVTFRVFGCPNRAGFPAAVSFVLNFSFSVFFSFLHLQCRPALLAPLISVFPHCVFSPILFFQYSSGCPPAKYFALDFEDVPASGGPTFFHPDLRAGRPNFPPPHLSFFRFPKGTVSLSHPPRLCAPPGTTPIPF